MLNIGIVDVGAISQKAYLPVMRSIGNVKWYMLYRDSYFYAITADGLFQFKNNQLMPIKAINAAKTRQGE